MPLNESVTPARSTLTREQKAEAERAIYQREENYPMAPQFTATEVENMRAILAAHDANHQGGIKEFDLNKPPVPPYVHQEYPQLLYGPNHSRVVVNNEEEREAHLEAGWSLKPVSAEASAAKTPELSAEEQAEVERLDRQARKPRKS